MARAFASLLADFGKNLITLICIISSCCWQHSSSSIRPLFRLATMMKPELDDFSFVIYRPERTTGRLEGNYYQGDQNYWRPSLSYQHKIDDIRSQLTPAEHFRQTLVTSGKHIRLIQRLEIRWNRHFDAFVHAATKVQSLHRGNVARAQYAILKQDFLVEQKRRQAKADAVAFFLEEKYEEAIDIVNRNLPGATDLVTIKMKALYRIDLHEECIATTEEVIDMEPLLEEAYYIQACCWLRLGDIDRAYATLKRCTIQIETPSRDTLCLYACAATRLHPPRYMEGVDSLTSVLKTTPKDFEALVDRAACYFCLQEWALGIKDLSFVLVFLPGHTKALLMRARAHSCIREWALARTDYQTALIYHPHCAEAQKGLEDIQDTVIVLPMLGDDLLDNEAT